MAMEVYQLFGDCKFIALFGSGFSSHHHRSAAIYFGYFACLLSCINC